MKSTWNSVFLIVLFIGAVSLTAAAQNQASVVENARMSTIVRLDSCTTQASDGQSNAPSRMDDKGCCVLKKSKYKPEWVFNDDVIRRQCIKDARDIGVDYDFYKEKKCEDAKKEINKGTAVPN